MKKFFMLATMFVVLTNGVMAKVYEYKLTAEQLDKAFTRRFLPALIVYTVLKIGYEVRQTNSLREKNALLETGNDRLRDLRKKN